MKFLQLSEEAIKSVKTNDFISYLKTNKWQLQKDGDNIMRWHFGGDRKKSIVLPLNKTYSDYLEAMSHALEGVAYIEGRNLIDVINSVVQIINDVLKVRVSGMYTQDGTIPIEEGAELIERTKDMLIAAANAVAASEPKTIYFGPRADNTNDFIRSVRLGQTEVGSYVITAYSSLPIIQDRIENDAEEYFSRRVYTKAAQALGAALDAKQTAVETGDIKVFGKYLDKGISANFCDAIAELRGENEQATINFNFTWSPYFKKPDVKNEFVFTPEDIPVIRDAAIFFRKMDPVTSFALTGIVVSLSHENKDMPGTIVIESSNKDFKGKRVRVTLDAGAYTNAIHAHEKFAIVFCTGRLVKDGHFFELKEVKDFRFEEVIKSPKG